MINILIPPRKTGGLTFWLTLLLLVSPPVALTAHGKAAPRYKSKTVIDFEGALVEGKSRKPYSSYLTQQKDSAFGDLHQWSPDLDHSLLESEWRAVKK